MRRKKNEEKRRNIVENSTICTGYSQKINDEKAAEIGATGYLMKPINREILARTLHKVLDETQRAAH